MTSKGPPSKPKPVPQPLSEVDTTVARPSAESYEVKHVTGRLPQDDEVSLAAPSPLAKGKRQVPRAAVGLRAAVSADKHAPHPVVSERRMEVRGRLEEGKQERQKKVWAKLDDAKTQGSQKLDRIKDFTKKSR